MTTCNDDVLWLAFLYVAGELPEAERAAFEVRLENEHDLRLAVAQAMELAETTRVALTATGQTSPNGLVLPSPASVGNYRRSGREQAVRWTLGILAGSLAVLLLSPGWFLPTSQSTDGGLAVGRFHSSGNPELALAWREAVESQHSLPTGEPLEAESGENWVSVTDEEWMDGESFLETPSWVLAAVAGVSDRAE